MGSPTAATVQEAIFWQYAGLIAARVHGANWKTRHRAFQMDTFKKLRSSEIVWSDVTRDQDRYEEELVQRKGPFCVYCERPGSEVRIHHEHMLPRVHGGPGPNDDFHLWNRVPACRDCNLSKGAKGLYEWKGYEGRHEIPRVAEGRYLKMLNKLHELRDTAAWGKDRLQVGFCPRCPQSGKAEKCPAGGPVKVIEMICAEAMILHGLT